MKRRLNTIFVLVLFNFLGATLVQPVLPLYAQRHFGASPQVISLLLASFFIAQFLAAPLLGRLSDRVGRLPVLIISQIGTFISFIVLGTAGSLPVLFAARILDGITGGNVIVAQAYVTDITPREQRTQGLGVIFMAFGLGFTIGPGLGGLIANQFGDSAPFFAGAIMSFITVLMTWLLLDESLTPEQRQARKAANTTRLRRSDILANTSLLLCMLIGFCAQFSIALLQGTIALFGEAVVFAGYEPAAVNLGVGLILTGIGVGQFMTQLLLLRPLVKRVGERRLVVIGAVLRGFGFLLLTVFTSPWLIGMLALPLIAAASGIMMPSVQSIVTTSVREDLGGAALGVYQSSVNLGIIVGTASGGMLFSLAYTLPYAVAGMVLLLTTLPALVLLRRGSMQPAEQPAAA